MELIFLFTFYIEVKNDWKLNVLLIKFSSKSGLQMVQNVLLVNDLNII